MPGVGKAIRRFLVGHDEASGSKADVTDLVEARERAETSFQTAGTSRQFRSHIPMRVLIGKMKTLLDKCHPGIPSSLFALDMVSHRSFFVPLLGQSPHTEYDLNVPGSVGRTTALH